MKNNEAPFFIPYEPDALWDKIRELVRTELQRAQDRAKPFEYGVQGLTQKPVFKAAEVCRMLNVSRQTLHTWTRDGTLRGYKIKSRLFYLWSDIEKLLAPKEGT